MVKSKVRILFKSGNSIDLEVEELKVTSVGNTLTALSWSFSNPKIMYISLSDIEAVFEILPKKRSWFT